MTLTTVRIRHSVFSFKGLVVLVGATLMLVSQSADYSYANLNTYVISYLRAQDGNVTYADWIFVAQAKPLAAGLLSPVGGEIGGRFGLKLSIALGFIIYSGGYMLTYLFLDYGIFAVAFSVGLCHGFSFVLCYAQTLGILYKWFSSGNRGLIGSIAVAGYGFGAVIWNPLETAFVNPDNIEAQPVPGGTDRYFTDEELLNRVPDLFLLLGGIFFIMGTIAFFLLREPSDFEQRQLQTLFEGAQHLPPNSPRMSIVSATAETVPDITEEVYSVRSKDVIRTKTFAKIWLSFFSISMLSSFMANYQKAYGQQLITDDTFFATAATIQNVFNGCSRLVWGIIFDYQGYQMCVFVISSICTAISFSFVNLLLFGENNISGAKAFYSIWTIGLFGFLPGCFSCYPPIVMQAFGPKYYSTNYTLVFTSTFVYSILLIVVTQTLFDYLDYGGMFLLTGAMGLIGMAATFFFPLKVSSNDFRSVFEGKSAADSEIGEESKEKIVHGKTS